MKLKIKKWGINGEGIAYYKKEAGIVMGALPDEVVDAEVVEDRDRYLLAETKKGIGGFAAASQADVRHLEGMRRLSVDACRL